MRYSAGYGRWLCYLPLLSMVIVFSTCMSGISLSRNQDFSFIYFSDLHADSTWKSVCPEENLYKMRRQIESCDFTVIGGDLTANGAESEFLMVRSFIGQLKKPYFTLPGNHDLVRNGIPDNRHYIEYIGKTHTCRFVRHKNTGLLFIDISESGRAQVSVNDSLLVRLREVASRIPPGLPVIVFTHFPLHPDSPQYAVKNTEPLFAILDSINVIGYFSGHYHSWKQYNRTGVPFFSAGTLLPAVKNHDGRVLHGYYKATVSGSKLKAEFISLDGRQRPSVTTSKSRATEVLVEPFLNGETDSAIIWTALAVERKIIESLWNSGIIVHSHILRNVPERKPSFHISGSITKKESLLLLNVKLSNSTGNLISTVTMSGTIQLFKKLRGVLGETILGHLQFTSHAAGKTDRCNCQPIASACVRAAKVKFDGGQVDQAIELLRTGAANSSCRTVFDALARLYEMKGVSDSVTLWKSRSSTIVNPCYSDIPFDTSKEPSPLPLLLSAMKKTESVLADTGFTCTFINVPDPEISAVIRYIDPKLYSLEAIILEKPAGMLISDLPADSSLHLVINGGYWEMDGSYRLSPSGLIISGGRNIAPLTTYGGSAVFYVRNRIPGLSWAKGFTITNDLTFALQCGPMLVEPDGRNGILTNDRVRLNRIAIGISGENVVIASVCGKKGKGLSLYDFAEFLRLPIDSGGTGCTVAMNLDGGGSVKAHTKNRNIPDIIGLWPVNNVIVVKNHSGK